MAGLVPEENDNSFKIQCFPLYSLILATGNRTVNYLSLDIEGAEFQVVFLSLVQRELNSRCGAYPWYRGC